MIITSRTHLVIDVLVVLLECDFSISCSRICLEDFLTCCTKIRIQSYELSSTGFYMDYRAGYFFPVYENVEPGNTFAPRSLTRGTAPTTAFIPPRGWKGVSPLIVVMIMSTHGSCQGPLAPVQGPLMRFPSVS